MPLTTCFNDFKKAVKGNLSEKEATELLEKVRSISEARYRKRLGSKAEAYNKTVDDLIESDKIKQKARKLQAFYSMLVAPELEKQITDGSKYLDRSLPGAFIGYESNVFKSRDSVLNSIRVQQIRLVGNMLSNLYKTKTYELFNDRKISTDLAKALWDKTSSKSEGINILVDTIKGIQKYARNMMREVGVSLEEAENYAAKTVHGIRKMKSVTGSGIKDSTLRGELFIKHKGDYDAASEEFNKTAYENWKNAIIPATDMAKSLEGREDDPAEVDKFFKSLYNARTTGINKFPIVNNVEVNHPFIPNAGGNLREKLQAQRVWYPKDGEAWAKYNERYGYGTTQDAIVAQLNEISHAVGVMKKLGASPKVAGLRIIKRIARKFRDVYPGIEKAADKARKALDAVLANPNDEMDGFLGKIFSSLHYMAYTRLGGQVLSSLPDVNVMASYLRLFGVKYLDAHSGFIKELMSGMPKGEYRELGLNLGVYSEGIMGALYSRFGSMGNPGVFSKLLNMQDKLSFIHYWDNIGRFAMGIMLSNQFSRLLNKSFDSLPNLTRNAFTRYGIDSGFWKLIQDSKGNLQTIKGRKFITPSIVDDINEDDILNYHYAGKDIDKNRSFKLDRAKQALKERLQNFFVDGSAYGKVFPDAGDLHIMRGRGSVAGNSIAGQLLKQVTTFKSFGVAQTRRTLGRFIYFNGAKSIADAIKTGSVDYSGMAQYLLGSIPYGYISLAAKYMARGYAPPSLDDKNTWKEILISGGTLFSYGDLVYDTYDKNGRVSSSILGPQINTAKDILNVIGEMSTGHGTTAKQSLIRLVQNNTPLINTFYFKKALDTILFEKLHEAVDPSYKYNQMQWEQQSGVTPLF